MRKKLIISTWSVTIAGLLFCLGPTFGKAFYRVVTPDSTISSWNGEFRSLDGAQTNNVRRIELCRRLTQRGIDVDPGIRDEAIEHNTSIRTIIIRICWQWQELLGT